jgi:aminoglycoside phosphotransferase family enzyme/predicted kinase
MDLTRVIDALGRPETYPFEVESIEVRQTHISVVALAGPYVYKVKKPVELGFLDFSTLELRRHFCHEEVRLNRRMAPDVYHGVVPLVEREGQLVLEADGDPLDYAVKMRRLPDDATLLERLQSGELGPAVMRSLGVRVAGFHAEAASEPKIDRYAHWDVVAGNARENLEQSRSQLGVCLHENVFERLSRLLERRLEEHRPLIESRARAHRARDTHGDLHLDHVYLFPDRQPPTDLVVIDCIEFNERFRYADPIADMAFLVMDLDFHGRRDLSEAFAEAYFAASGDARGRELLDFYVAYRAAVRGKVEGLAAAEDEVPPSTRRDALRRAKGHWLLALSALEAIDRRPCLVLIGGLPGTGKTTLSRRLAHEANMELVTADRVRKELAGVSPEESARAQFGEGIYTAEWNDRTYDACLERALEHLFRGERVIVDASFREAGRRRRFLEAGVAAGVQVAFLECTAADETVRARLAHRESGVSDADWAIHRAAADAWEPDDVDDPRWTSFPIPTDGGPDSTFAAARRALRSQRLVE